jgi:hypothetical protein
MKPVAFVFAFAWAGAIGLATVSVAQAGFLDTSFGLEGPGYGGPGTGGAYYVARPGEPITLGEPHYWGGPYWTTCRGYHPPFQTYRIPPASCRPVAVVVRREPRHHVRVRLK